MAENPPQHEKGWDRRSIGLLLLSIDFQPKTRRLNGIDYLREFDTLIEISRIRDDPMEQPSFEQALDELKSIVQALERGDRPLEESLLLFEKGVNLVTLCTRKLEEVEKRVEMLVRDQGGALETRPFEPVDQV